MEKYMDVVRNQHDEQGEILISDDALSGTGNIETRAGEMYKWAIKNNNVIWDDPNGLIIIVAPNTMDLLGLMQKIREHLEHEIEVEKKAIELMIKNMKDGNRAVTEDKADPKQAIPDYNPMHSESDRVYQECKNSKDHDKYKIKR